MVDLHGKDKGNISLPTDLQSPDPQNYEPEDEENHPLIINLQRAMYETHINEQQIRIDRLQARNEDLKKFCDQVKNISENGSTEAENEIVELNNNMATVTSKVDELRKKCDEIEKIRQTEKLDHIEKIKHVEENFEKTRIQLYSELKAITAKINMIEDYKLADESLRAKFDSQHKTILRREEEIQETLTQLSYKSKIHKHNLRKEAYKQILNASEAFQLELKDTVSPTVQRLMRENIVLENELALLWSDHANMEDEMSDFGDLIGDHREQIKDAKTRIKRQIITSKIQNLLLEKLRSVHSIVTKELSKSFEPPKDFEKQYLTILEKSKNTEFSTSDYRRRKLEVLLHQERVGLASVNNFKTRTSLTLKECSNALSNLKSAVNSALMINKRNIDEDFKNMNLDTFAFYVLNIIEDCDSKKWLPDSESIETVADSSNVYAMGDLGFEPKYIEIVDQVNLEVKQVHSTSILSTFEILKELEKLTDKPYNDQSQSLSSQSTDISDSNKGVRRSKSEDSKKSSIDIKKKYETISIEGEEDYEDFEDMLENEENELEFEMLENYMNLE